MCTDPPLFFHDISIFVYKERSVRPRVVLLGGSPALGQTSLFDFNAPNLSSYQWIERSARFNVNRDLI
jgi:hypothetical protein